MYVGIDVSATRGFDVCALDERRRISLLAVVRSPEAMEALARGLPRDATIAIDAPPRPSRDLVPGKGYRVAERELHALGLSLYPVPRTEESAKEWMRAGFGLYRLLEGAGFPLWLDGEPSSGVAIEVYPHLSYVALTGARRGGSSKLEWSRAALRGRVGGLPSNATQDQLDAACAALTAWHFVQGQWSGYGDPREGVIVAPKTAHDLAALRSRDSRDQMALPIESGHDAAPARIGPLRPSTFAERVLRVVGQIPPGRVATYGDIARWAGNAAGARAVGTLMARHAFQVPCHRVVDSRGAPPPHPSDAGELLRREGVPFEDGRVRLDEGRWEGPR
jgi:methylated-DNA-protein-cysteine methyltransferase related protein